jgi:hypothetical protein
MQVESSAITTRGYGLEVWSRVVVEVVGSLGLRGI